MAYKAAVRSGSLKSLNAGKSSISAAEKHAKRLDPVAQKRRVRPADPIAWAKGDSGPLDYVAAFKAHKKKSGAGERKNAALAMEMKLIVSPSWLSEDGRDPRDPSNDRVRKLMVQATAWAESWGGDEAVWAVRYDTDERGAGVVDVFMSPTREQRHKNGKSKLVISTRKAKAELLAAEQALDPELKTSGAAMQSSWARWCQENLDARIERGKPKLETNREHIHADVYAAEAEAARRKAAEELEEAQRLARAAEERLAPLRAAVAALEAHEAETAARKAAVRDEVLLHELKEMCRRRGLLDQTLEPALWSVLEPRKAEKAREAVGVTNDDGPRAVWEKAREIEGDGARDLVAAYKQNHSVEDEVFMRKLVDQIHATRTWSDLLDQAVIFASRLRKWASDRIEEMVQRPSPIDAQIAQNLPKDLRDSLRAARSKGEDEGRSFDLN